MPSLGSLGPLSPLPTPFGPRHQHKERDCWGRKAMWSFSLWGGGAEAPGNGGGGVCVSGIHSCQVAPGGPQVCKPTTTGSQACPGYHMLLHWPIAARPTGAHTGWLGQGRGSRSMWKLIHPLTAGSTANITH